MRFWMGPRGLAKSRVYPRSLAIDYADVMDQAKHAEDLGYDAFSAPEHHFTYDGFCPYPLAALAGIAAATTRIKLVTGAFLLPLHDPLRVVEDAALLDALSNGRLILGLGMGYRPLEFSGLASEKKTRGVRLVETMQLLREAFRSETFTFEGRFHSHRKLSVRPRPVQRPEIEMWFCGGTTASAARRAGKAGVGYWIANSSFDHARQCIEAYRQAGREAGWSESQLRVATFKDMCLASSVSRAEEIRLQVMRAFYDEHILGYGYLVDETGQHLYNPPKDHPLYRRFVESIFCGTPEMAVAELKRYEAIGVEAVYPATWEGDLFVKEVMPHFSRSERAGSAT